VKTVVLAWIFFVITGVFISLIVPLGEGFDEPWHLGYTQYVAQNGSLPPGPALKLSVEIVNFLERQPIGWRLKAIYSSLHSQEEYWHMDRSQQVKVDTDLRELRFGATYRQSDAPFAGQYESHQAPLFYIITVPVFLASAKRLSFADTFLALRIWAVILASTVIPLSYMIAKRVSPSLTAANSVAVLVALFPGIYPDIVRVSNDALAVPIAAAIFLLVVEYINSPSMTHGALAAVAVGLGLLTKAFFIPVIAALIVAFLWLKHFRTAATFMGVAAAGCIWYAKNLWVTGSLTGLPETVSANTTLGSTLASIPAIQWPGVLRLAAVSHVWMGNWSLLQYRSWIYDTVLVFFAIGMFGFGLYLFQTRPTNLAVLIMVYLAYGSSLLYYATQVFQSTGVPVIQGWYLSPMIPLEAMVFVIGLEFLFSGRGLIWGTLVVGICFLTMLTYGNAFIAAPYYSGLTEHAPSGHLRAYHPHLMDVQVIASRLTRLHSWLPHALLPALGLTVVLCGLLLLCTYYRASLQH